MSTTCSLPPASAAVLELARLLPAPAAAAVETALLPRSLLSRSPPFLSRCSRWSRTLCCRGVTCAVRGDELPLFELAESGDCDEEFDRKLDCPAAACRSRLDDVRLRLRPGVPGNKRNK